MKRPSQIPKKSPHLWKKNQSKLVIKDINCVTWYRKRELIGGARAYGSSKSSGLLEFVVDDLESDLDLPELLQSLNVKSPIFNVLKPIVAVNMIELTSEPRDPSIISLKLDVFRVSYC